MKKIYLIALFSLIVFISFGQYTTTQTLGNSTTNVKSRGGLATDSSYTQGGFTDTATANLGFIKNIPFTQIRIGTNYWMRNSSATRWILITGGSGTICAGLQSGGNVAWTNTGLIFSVTEALYCINGSSYHSPTTNITLNAADPSLPRLDVLAVDVNNNVVKITGTPSATPSVPTVDPLTQLYLTAILVPAGATTPGGITTTIIYDENTEWVTSSNLSAGSVNFNSTVTPFHLTKNAVLNPTASGTISFQQTSLSLNLSSYNNFTLYIKMDIANPLFDIGVNILNNGASISTSSLNLINYGFNPNITTYQTITIPATAFPVISNTFNGVLLKTASITGTNVHIDYIQLQTGVPSGGSSPYITNVRRRSGTDTVEVQKNGIWQYAFIDSTGGGGGINIYNSDGTITDEYRNINGNGNSINFLNNTDFYIEGSESVLLKGDRFAQSAQVGVTSGYSVTIGTYTPLEPTHNSALEVYRDSVGLSPYKGNFAIDSLNSSTSTKDKLLVWDSISGIVRTRTFSNVIDLQKAYNNNSSAAPQIIATNGTYTNNVYIDPNLGAFTVQDNSLAELSSMASTGNAAYIYAENATGASQVQARPDSITMSTYDMNNVGHSSIIGVYEDSLTFYPYQGKLIIDSLLTSASTKDKLLVWDSVSQTIGTRALSTIGNDSLDIPLQGTYAGKPVTGDIEFSDGSILKQIDDVTSLATAGTTFQYVNPTGLYYQTPSDNTKFQIFPDGVQVTSTFSNAKGISGAQDYSSNITNLDYPQLIKVKSIIHDSLTHYPDSIRRVALNWQYRKNGNWIIYGTDSIGITNISGLITAGTNVTITGSGTSGSPYNISASGGSGGDTALAQLSDVSLKYPTSSIIPKLNENLTYNATDSAWENKLLRGVSYPRFFKDKVWWAEGNSITAGSAASTFANSYVGLVSTALGVSYVDSAVGGSTMRNILYRNFKNLAAVRPNINYSDGAGVNELGLGTGNAVRSIFEAKKAEIANLLLDTVRAASTLTQAGTWSNLTTVSSKSTLKSLGNPLKATAANSTLTYTAYGDNVVVGSFADTSAVLLGNFSVSIDGVIIDTVSPSNKAIGYYYAPISPAFDFRMPMVSIYSGLQYKNHIVVIKSLSNTETSIDYVGRLMNPRDALGILELHILKSTNAGYVLDGGRSNDNRVDSANYQIDSLISYYQSLGYYNVSAIPTENYFSKYDLFDGLHPTDAGHAEIARSFLETVSQIEKGVTFQGRNGIITDKFGNIGLATPLPLNGGTTDYVNTQGHGAKLILNDTVGAFGQNVIYFAHNGAEEAKIRVDPAGNMLDIFHGRRSFYYGGDFGVGNEVIGIDSVNAYVPTGKINIGTTGTDPSYSVDVVKANPNMSVTATDPTATNGYIMKNSTGQIGSLFIGGNTSSFPNIVGFYISATNGFAILNSVATSIFTVSQTGNVKFNGALMPNNSAGTSGQHLISAGAGVPPVWRDTTAIVGGTYTPTLSNTTNVSSSTPVICHYARVGNQVTVTGSAGVVTTLAVATVLSISLPVASNLAAVTDVAGVGQASSAVAANAFVQGNSTSDLAELTFTGLSVGGAGTIYFTFTYTIL